MSENSSSVSNKNTQGMFFSTEICPKMDFESRISKIQLSIWNQLYQDTICANFQAKNTILVFLAQICPKSNLRSEFWKSKPRIGISSSKITGAPIFRQNGLVWLFWPKFTQKWILGSEFRKSNSGFESPPPSYHVRRFLD